jgi:hypothetical protein
MARAISTRALVPKGQIAALEPRPGQFQAEQTSGSHSTPGPLSLPLADAAVR